MKQVILFIFISFSVASQVVVKTQHGSVEGLISPSLLIFKGIPFAQPPIGDLRWRAPQENKPWKGIKKCTSFSPSPFQDEPKPFYCWSKEFIAQPESLSEDCLYLNIWAPKTKAKKLPVMVWIYGGGFMSGSSNCDIYDGSEMAKKGVIFVSINYRVGVFGFMAHPELSKESNSNSSGNYGILDQIAALKWVQQNISAFNGNPENVTILGQSAGAFSVNTLIATPLAKGLFHKAILQSGGLLSGSRLFKKLSESENQGEILLKATGKKSISDLRQISSQEILTLSKAKGIGGFGLTLDDFVLPLNLNSHFKNQKQNTVPILAGWVTGDGSFLGDKQQSPENFRKNATIYRADSSNFLNLFPVKDSESVKRANQLISRLGFACLPAHLLALYNPKPSYLYEFDLVPPDKTDFPNYGAFHTSEVPYALHTLHKWERPWREVDRELEEMMSSSWVQFAKTGSPQTRLTGAWSNYNKESTGIFRFSSKPYLDKILLKNELSFFEKQYLISNNL
jgi:para-nitrobenzyl esterase